MNVMAYLFSFYNLQDTPYFIIFCECVYLFLPKQLRNQINMNHFHQSLSLLLWDLFWLNLSLLKCLLNDSRGVEDFTVFMVNENFPCL